MGNEASADAAPAAAAAAPSPPRTANGCAGIMAAADAVTKYPGSSPRTSRGTVQCAVYGDAVSPVRKAPAGAGSAGGVFKGLEGGAFDAVAHGDPHAALAHRHDRAVPPRRGKGAASSRTSSMTPSAAEVGALPTKRERTRDEVSQRMTRDLSSFAGLIDAAWHRHQLQRMHQLGRIAESRGAHCTRRRCWSVWVGLLLRRARLRHQRHTHGGTRTLWLWTDRSLRTCYWQKLLRWAALRKLQRGQGDAHAAVLAAREAEYGVAVAELREQIEDLMARHGQGGPPAGAGMRGAAAARASRSPSPRAAVQGALQQQPTLDPQLVDDLNRLLLENKLLEGRINAVEAECAALRDERVLLADRAERCGRVEGELRVALARLADAEQGSREVRVLREENAQLRDEQRLWRRKQEEMYERLYKRADSLAAQDASAEVREQFKAEVAAAAELAAQLTATAGARQRQQQQQQQRQSLERSRTEVREATAPQQVAHQLHRSDQPRSAPELALAPLVLHPEPPRGRSPQNAPRRELPPLTLAPAQLRRHDHSSDDWVMTAQDMVRSVEEKGTGSPRHPHNTPGDVAPALLNSRQR
eukprot:TRINITY_DN3488_c1_g1_i2.p1 TRINITY_DN3488_c1_g1~~TRINITY_DN3488_c1_g1_i2.p1  ORF type:complete len:625 (+),score=161.28 TRINITY_DN3488_c1_g1_i2:118-1875(+)